MMVEGRCINSTHLSFSRTGTNTLTSVNIKWFVMSGVNESHQHSGLELEGVSTPTSLSYTDLIVELLS